jgi:hypothetical protein
VERVTSCDELDAYKRRVRDHPRAYLDSLGDHEPERPREMNVDSESPVYSPADIFAYTLLQRTPAPRGTPRKASGPPSTEARSAW